METEMNKGVSDMIGGEKGRGEMLVTMSLGTCSTWILRGKTKTTSVMIDASEIKNDTLLSTWLLKACVKLGQVKY
jgi:hypothetical protein